MKPTKFIQVRIKTAERYGLDIIAIAEFMDEFNKSLVIDDKLIYVLDNNTGEWMDTFYPIKFKCPYCKEIAADIFASEMEFETECPYCNDTVSILD